MISVNLAPFKYFDILSDKTAPIDRIESIKFQLNNGRILFESHGWLNADIKSDRIEKSALYGNCDSTGSDSSFYLAYWKCISELMERWAFHQLLKSRSNLYGMDIDSTTTGFAALPFWPLSKVREQAMCEAIERWAISNWWKETLQSELIQIDDCEYGLVKLDVKDGFGFVVITYKEIKKSIEDYDPEDTLYCYGFAHGKDLKSAEFKAVIEMNRNERVLSTRRGQTILGINDRRLRYFSGKNGHAHFLSKIGKVKLPSKNVPAPIVDSLVPGEWNKFAKVWRCLLPNTDYCWNDETHFMF